MALYNREERANFSCMNVVSCELTYEKYFKQGVPVLSTIKTWFRKDINFQISSSSSLFSSFFDMIVKVRKFEIFPKTNQKNA